jgi:hypothetical protein
LPYRRRTGEWACPFQVKGAGPQHIKEARGIDAFQALHLVFQGVRKELESKEYEVTWLDLDLDTVLPRWVPAFGDRAFTARLNKLIDSEMIKYNRAGHARLVKLAKTDKSLLPAVKVSARSIRRLTSA